MIPEEAYEAAAEMLWREFLVELGESWEATGKAERANARKWAAAIVDAAYAVIIEQAPTIKLNKDELRVHNRLAARLNVPLPAVTFEPGTYALLWIDE